MKPLGTERHGARLDRTPTVRRTERWWPLLISSFLSALVSAPGCRPKPILHNGHTTPAPRAAQCPLVTERLGPLARAQENWIVVFATARGVWIDGKAVGTLTQGRIPMLSGPKARAGCPKLTKAALDRAFKLVLKRRDPSTWKMKLNVSYSVSDDVVQLILTRAGRLDVAKMVVHRFMEHP